LWVTLAPQLQLGDQNPRRQQFGIAIVLASVAVFSMLRARHRDRQ
jgi:hypothetical protein